MLFLIFSNYCMKEYNVRVASRYFKGPELLVDMQVWNVFMFVNSMAKMILRIMTIHWIYGHLVVCSLAWYFARNPFFMGMIIRTRYSTFREIIVILSWMSCSSLKLQRFLEQQNYMPTWINTVWHWMYNFNKRSERIRASLGDDLVRLWDFLNIFVPNFDA